MLFGHLSDNAPSAEDWVDTYSLLLHKLYKLEDQKYK